MQLLDIAACFSDEFELRRVGVHLDLDINTIDAITINYKGNIQEAAYQILKKWKNGQCDRKQAYIKLWNTLTDPGVKLSMIAHDVLGKNKGL